jgi:hypothetical protein
MPSEITPDVSIFRPLAATLSARHYFLNQLLINVKSIACVEAQSD